MPACSVKTATVKEQPQFTPANRPIAGHVTKRLFRRRQIPTMCWLIWTTFAQSVTQPPDGHLPVSVITTRRSLTGAHTAAACIACHATTFAGTPTTCYSCHQTDYESVAAPNNHVTNNFSHNCTSCHSTSAWLPSLNHNSSPFRLPGAYCCGLRCLSRNRVCWYSFDLLWLSPDRFRRRSRSQQSCNE